MSKRRSGFTLVEIMVVVVIIGLLAAMVGPRLIGQSHEAKVTAAKAQMANFRSALELYHLNNGFYPTTEQGLEALVSKPSGRPQPKNYPDGGYLQKKEVPKDPWSNPYIYEYPGSSSGEFDLYSLGADGEEGGEDKNADIRESE